MFQEFNIILKDLCLKIFILKKEMVLFILFVINYNFETQWYMFWFLFSL